MIPAIPMPPMPTGNAKPVTFAGALRIILREIPRVVIGLILLAAIGVNFANIVGRYVFLAPLPWRAVLSFLVIWASWSAPRL